MKPDKITFIKYLGSNELLIEKKEQKRLLYIGDNKNKTESLSKTLKANNIKITPKCYNKMAVLNYEEADEKTQTMIENTKLEQLNGRISRINIKEGFLIAASTASFALSAYNTYIAMVSEPNYAVSFGLAVLGGAGLVIARRQDKKSNVLRDERSRLLQRKKDSLKK